MAGLNKFYLVVAEEFAARLSMVPVDGDGLTQCVTERQAEAECLLMMLMNRFEREDKMFSRPAFEAAVRAARRET